MLQQKPIKTMIVQSKAHVELQIENHSPSQKTNQPSKEQTRFHTRVPKPLKTSDQKKKEEEAKKPIHRPVTGRKSNLKKASTDEIGEGSKSKETSTQI